MATAVFAALLSPANAATRSRHHRPRPPTCAHQKGPTLLRHGAVRVYTKSGLAYGCLLGSRRKFSLWQIVDAFTTSANGKVEQVVGPYLAYSASSGSQYEADQRDTVIDLRSGHTYSVASVIAPLSGGTTADPPTPGPYPLRTFVLGPDGRSARLYNSYAAGASPGTAPSGEVLDLIGFRATPQQIASSGPGGIAPGSVTFDGHTVGWTQDGVAHTVSR